LSHIFSPKILFDLFYHKKVIKATKSEKEPCFHDSFSLLRGLRRESQAIAAMYQSGCGSLLFGTSVYYIIIIKKL